MGKPSTPDYTAIIDAVTRREKARFLPDGMTAANQLGPTDAVPAKVTVHTDARLRPIHLDKLIIDFKLTAPSRLYWAGRPAMRIVQALHWLHDMLPADGDLILNKIGKILADPKQGKVNSRRSTQRSRRSSHMDGDLIIKFLHDTDHSHAATLTGASPSCVATAPGAADRSARRAG